MNTLIPMTRMLDAALKASFDNCATADRRALLTPRADVLEGDQEYRILLDLPGVTNDSLEISLEHQTLTVKAAREAAVPEGFALRRHERAGTVQFSRTFNLGTSVDSEKISAHLDQGVLQLTLPKSAVSLPRRIEVQ